MGKKIFISYKYADTAVAPINPDWLERLWPTKARDYVDLIQGVIGIEHVNKGEKDGEDLSTFEDVTIASKLRDRIYDSSVTAVLISPNMVDRTKPIDDQWIPWEIAYSLREKTRSDRTSRTNGVLSVVLPDKQGSYEYFIKETNCPCCRAILYDGDAVFPIIVNNMFNRKQIREFSCAVGHATTVFREKSSYIITAKWVDFIRDPNSWIDCASEVHCCPKRFENALTPLEFTLKSRFLG